MELRNTLSQVAGKLDLVEIAELSSTEAVDYPSNVVVAEAVEVQVALMECYQSCKGCSSPAVLGIVVVVVVLG